MTTNCESIVNNINDSIEVDDIKKEKAEKEVKKKPWRVVTSLQQVKRSRLLLGVVAPCSGVDNKVTQLHTTKSLYNFLVSHIVDEYNWTLGNVHSIVYYSQLEGFWLFSSVLSN